MQPVLLINPKRLTRRAGGVRKGSAAAKAWGARMRRLRSLKTNPKHRTTHHKRRMRRNPSARASVYRARTAMRGLSSSSLMSMIKTAGIGAAGAVLNDIAFGYLGPMLPTSFQTPIDPSTSGMNPLYYMAKGGLAIGLGIAARKMSRSAGAMAEGALTVTAYELIKAMVPSGITMGAYVNPRAQVQIAQQAQARRIGMSRQSMGAYIPMQQREGARR